jgi:hypothetical protein
MELLMGPVPIMSSVRSMKTDFDVALADEDGDCA